MTRDEACKRLPGKVVASVLVTIYKTKQSRITTCNSDASTTCTEKENVNGAPKMTTEDAKVLWERKKDLRRSMCEMRRRIIEENREN